MESKSARTEQTKRMSEPRGPTIVRVRIAKKPKKHTERVQMAEKPPMRRRSRKRRTLLFMWRATRWYGRTAVPSATVTPTLDRAARFSERPGTLVSLALLALGLALWVLLYNAVPPGRTIGGTILLIVGAILITLLVALPTGAIRKIRLRVVQLARTLPAEWTEQDEAGNRRIVWWRTRNPHQPQHDNAVWQWLRWVALPRLAASCITLGAVATAAFWRFVARVLPDEWLDDDEDGSRHLRIRKSRRRR